MGEDLSSPPQTRTGWGDEHSEGCHVITHQSVTDPSTRATATRAENAAPGTWGRALACLVPQGPPGKPARRTVQQHALKRDTQLSHDAGIYPQERSAFTTTRHRQDSRGCIPYKRKLTATNVRSWGKGRRKRGVPTMTRSLHSEGHSCT